jgi:hypothetical protein
LLANEELEVMVAALALVFEEWHGTRIQDSAFLD